MFAAPIATPVRRATDLFSRIPDALTLLFLRIVVAQVFWASGQTKVEGWHLKPGTIDLFREEYRVPVLSPELAAYLSATAEHVLPILLVLGLGARFASLGLIGMTLVIQIFVYPDAWWPVHSLWLAMLLVILSKGAGAISLDRLIRDWSHGR